MHFNKLKTNTMKTLKLTTLLMILSLVFCGFATYAQDDKTESSMETKIDGKEKLVVVWTSGDREVALKMVFMYTYNAKKYGWWKDITLLVWGPSSKLLSEDVELQDYVKEMAKVGVNLLACKGCTDQYGVSDKLTEIGVTVKYTGTDLTKFIKENHVVTF